MKNNKEAKIKKEKIKEDEIKSEPNQEAFNYEDIQNENNNLNKDEDSESSDDFDVDCDRLTLIQVKEIMIRNLSRKKKKVSFLNKKRANPDKFIIYDSSTKKIYNCFCPDVKELDRFLQNCSIKEININQLNNKFFIEKNSQNVFDPQEFMEKNNIIKPSLSIEDLFQYPDKREIEEPIHSETKEIKPMSLFLPRMSAEQFILRPNFELKDEQQIESAKDEFIKLGKIINEDILSTAQKSWLSVFFKNVNNLPLDKVICKDKKLEIVFDLDSTCMFSFVNNTNINDAKYYFNRYPEKNIIILSFEHEQKILFSSVIIRKGLKEFVDYVKDFCNFHVRTLGVKNYAEKIIQKLEQYLKIKFKYVKARELNNQTKKYLSEFNTKKINNENTIIFDDSVTVWEKDLANVIPSKKFIDKECGIYSLKEKDKNKNTLNNDLTCILNSHSNFYYNKIENSEKPSWKNQIVCNEKTCPFYQYRDINSQKYNAVFSGEYLTSPKFQFIYMKNVIKSIYYLIYHNEVPLFDAIKLLRLNSLNGKCFYLKYLNPLQKNILTDIIVVCGGEIINEPDESISIMMKKIFLVCSMEYFDKNNWEIEEELKKHSNFILVNEKFVLDSYYFMTDLENGYMDSEYCPKLCY